MGGSVYVWESFDEEMFDSLYLNIIKKVDVVAPAEVGKLVEVPFFSGVAFVEVFVLDRTEKCDVIK